MRREYDLLRSVPLPGIARPVDLIEDRESGSLTVVLAPLEGESGCRGRGRHGCRQPRTGAGRVGLRRPRTTRSRDPRTVAPRAALYARGIVLSGMLPARLPDALRCQAD